MRSILRELPAVAPNDKFAVVVPGSMYDGLLDDLDRATTNSSLPPDFMRFYLRKTDSSDLYAQFYQRLTWLPNIIKKFQADVLFSSTGFGVWNSPCPEVLLLPNSAYFCQAYEEKSWQLRQNNLNLYIRRCLSLLSIQAAHTVLFPTESIKREVQRLLSLEHKPTQVHHYGVDLSAFSVNDPPRPAIADKVQRWKKEGYKILLHVSWYAVHKNIEVVLEALPAVLRAGHKIKWLTTLSREKTGDKPQYDAFFQRAEALGLSEIIESSGYLPHEELVWLYRHADLFVFPSYTESFGQPLIEAMAAGLPIVASDRPVHRELGGDAVLYFDTFDPTDCAQKILHALGSQGATTDWRARSKQQAARYDWRAYARQLIDLLHSVALVGRS
ncbi:glycosyltransferase family 4 protein [Myxococcota bacterium]|nr:glycosyltransferase family 4 protein [Myxococcota bacterium]